MQAQREGTDDRKSGDRDKEKQELYAWPSKNAGSNHFEELQVGVKFSVLGLGLPEADAGKAATGILEATTLTAGPIYGALATIGVGLDQSAALKVFEHGFHKLRGGAEPGCENAGFERPAVADFFHEKFKHIYSALSSCHDLDVCLQRPHPVRLRHASRSPKGEGVNPNFRMWAGDRRPHPKIRVFYAGVLRREKRKGFKRINHS
jgi:hypothetical protein